jgi:hypothetical protein
MTTTGALNGTKVFLEVKAPGDVWVPIGGQVSHTETITTNIIEITTKTAMSYRELLPDKGIQMVDYSTEVIFVSQQGYDLVRALAGNKGIADFRISADESIGDPVQLMVASFADTSADNEALKGTINLLSSDIF